VILLDEATSHVDQVTEGNILRNLRASGATLITVTHRAATVRDADQILMLESGVVVAHGTHPELMRSSPRYREWTGDAFLDPAARSAAAPTSTECQEGDRIIR
jgi:ATP-binding cassette subfamily B protein